MGGNNHHQLQGEHGDCCSCLTNLQRPLPDRSTLLPVLLRRCAVQDDPEGNWTPSDVEHHEVLQQAAAQQQTLQQIAEVQGDTGPLQRPTADTETKLRPTVPNLRIVIMVAGTRGDVQPFIALGLRLQVSGSQMCWGVAQT